MQKKIKQLTSNPFIQGSFIFTIASIIVHFFNYLFNFFIAHNFGPAGFGEITTLFSYISLISFPLLILTITLVQKISAQKDYKFKYAASIHFLLINLIKRWWLVLIFILSLSPFMYLITNLSPKVGIFIIPFSLLAIGLSFYEATFQGLKLFLVLSVVTVIIAFFKLSSVIPSFFNSKDIFFVLLIQFAANTLIVLTIFKIFDYFVSNENHQKPDKNIVLKLFKFIRTKHFIITFLSALGITAYSTIDIIFVKKYFSAYESGIYNAWSLMAKIILYILGPVIQVSFVFFAEDKRHSTSQKILFSALILLFFISSSVAVIYYLFPRTVIDVLFGESFRDVIPYLFLTYIFGIIYGANNLFNNYFLAKRSIVSLTIAIGMIVYILLLFIIKKQIIWIMYLNIIFGACILLIYLGLYLAQRKNKI